MVTAWGDVCVNLIVIIISQCIHILKHYTVHHEIIIDNLMQKKKKKEEEEEVTEIHKNHRRAFTNNKTGGSGHIQPDFYKIEAPDNICIMDFCETYFLSW